MDNSEVAKAWTAMCGSGTGKPSNRRSL